MRAQLVKHLMRDAGVEDPHGEVQARCVEACKADMRFSFTDSKVETRVRNAAVRHEVDGNTTYFSCYGLQDAVDRCVHAMHGSHQTILACGR